MATRRLSATRLAVNLLQEKGIFGLYRGMGATALRDVTFSIMYFPLFAHLDTFVGLLISCRFLLTFLSSLSLCFLQGPRRSDGTGTVFYWSFLSGCLASTVAAFLVTPMDGKVVIFAQIHIYIFELIFSTSH